MDCGASRPHRRNREQHGSGRPGKPGSTVLAQRNPTLLLRFIGEFLLRLGARAFDGLLLFHEAPRKERCPESTVAAFGRALIGIHPQQPGAKLARLEGACPASQHLSDLQALGGKILALGVRKQTQPLGNPNQHPCSRERSGGRREQCHLIAHVARFGQECGHLQTRLDQLVTNGELVVAGKLGGPLDDPHGQVFHPQRHHCRIGRLLRKFLDRGCRPEPRRTFFSGWFHHHVGPQKRCIFSL